MGLKMAKTRVSLYMDAELVEAYYGTIERGLRSRYNEAVLLGALAHDARKQGNKALMERLLKIAKRLHGKDAAQIAKEQRAIEIRANIFKEPYR